MRACCARIETFPFLETPKFTPAFYRDLARNLVSQHPFVVEKYFQPALRARLAELLHRATAQPFDLLLCDFLQPSLNVLGLPFGAARAVPAQRRIGDLRAALPGTRSAQEPAAQRPGEGVPVPAVAQAAGLRGRGPPAGSTTTSWSATQDCATMARLYGVTNTLVDPHRRRRRFFQPQPGAEAPGHELVFTGSMDWLPNVDGITWFAERGVAAGAAGAAGEAVGGRAQAVAGGDRAGGEAPGGHRGDRHGRRRAPLHGALARLPGARCASAAARA